MQSTISLLLLTSRSTGIRVATRFPVRAMRYQGVIMGVVGGVTGAAEGIKRGINSGSHSTPAAALALGAIGVAGLVEWPVLLAVGGGALLLHRMNRKPQNGASPKANLKPVPSEPSKKAAPQK